MPLYGRSIIPPRSVPFMIAANIAATVLYLALNQPSENTTAHVEISVGGH